MNTELHLPSAPPEGWKETPKTGLSQAEAAERKKNVMPRDDGKPTVRIITENVFTLFNGLNLLLALALLFVGSYRNMLFLAIVVMYDAMGVRYETGREAKILNRMRERDITEGREPLFDKPLDEKMGHTLSEVIVGVLIGIIAACVMSLWAAPLIQSLF